MRTMTEKERRVYWQDLCYHAMHEIDKAYGRKVSRCEGTTEATFKADMTKLREDARGGFRLADEHRLQKELLELVHRRLEEWEAGTKGSCDNVRCLIPALRTFLKK